ncbi:hypothetical protein [Litoreibacter roseus]|uniref:Uncharacterized protein n=1 Tax=Litoreibacter roseus TaxID=2601869 RepID=A0A6N6JNQ6_9RHOB|nr:hypothetical protein [Litoreibacter roseus]GFE67239.1 hypothetical protein KIN_43130 [Litoreibacter roseus]
MVNGAQGLRTFDDLRQDINERCGNNNAKASHVLVAFMDDQDAWGKTPDQLDRIVAGTTNNTIHGTFTSAQEEYLSEIAPAVDQVLDTHTRQDLSNIDTKVSKLRGFWPFSVGVIQSVLGAFLAAAIATFALYQSEFIRDTVRSVADTIGLYESEGKEPSTE